MTSFACTLILEVTRCHPGVICEEAKVHEALGCPGPVCDGADLVRRAIFLKAPVSAVRACSTAAVRAWKGRHGPTCLLKVLFLTRFLKILNPSPLFADTLFQLKVCTE